MKRITLLFTFSLLLQVAICYMPRKCKSQDDCAPYECCVLSMNRYATPQCEGYGQADDDCLMENDPENKTLIYPNGPVEYTGIYRIMCPCAQSLQCVRAKCSYL